MSHILSWISNTLMAILNFIMPILDFIGPTMTKPAVVVTMNIIFWLAVGLFVLYWHKDQRLHALISLTLIGYLYAGYHYALVVQHWLQGLLPGTHWMILDAIFVIPALALGYLILCLGDLLQGPKRRLPDGANLFRRRHWHYDSPDVDDEVLNNIDCHLV